ncbi:tetratricopeptide repeat protein [uncultured Brachyspira sp.]|uniref:tetratricopeptide repeat protein n=1 Tax=uncultured Brachyspira sp. TaxID=221953 RepID=UPI00263065FF|nr:tetratricopeptide repeat protein [uncultured Brachyspira sp.]
MEAYGNRAIVLYNLNKNEEAIKDCDKAIELDSEYWLLYFNRASIKLNFAETNENPKKLYDEALEDIKKSYELASVNENYLIKFKELLLVLANEGFEIVIDFCKELKLL